MNQQPNGNQQNYYNSGNQVPPAMYPQGYPQQPVNGQQWNAAPNFNGQPNGNPNAAQPGKPAGKSDKNKKAKKNKKGNGSVVGWIFLGIFMMIVLGVIGGVLGYNTAISARQAEYSRRSMMAAAEQYQWALSDIEQGNYANAKTRLDYVIEVDPAYPGAMETYQQVMLALYPTASPTPQITATPAPTATVDTRGEEELFQSIQQSIYSNNWEYAISLINALRDRNINYRGIEVDGMYYIALRNYGMQQINAGYLENGVYNITLAESFGPIDNQAESLRNAARAYLSGAGFWEINWIKALEYYSNAAQVMPNLMDRATGMTANQRYAEASFAVAADYAAHEDYCGAIPYYQQGLAVAGGESTQLTATAVYLECYPPEPTVDPALTEDQEYTEFYEQEEEFYIPDSGY